MMLTEISGSQQQYYLYSLICLSTRAKLWVIEYSIDFQDPIVSNN